MPSKENAEGAAKAFRVWINGRRGRVIRESGAVLKDGPAVLKTVTFGHYGNGKTGEVKKRTLRFRSHHTRDGIETNFDDNETEKSSWFCDDVEIDRLLAFLEAEIERTGQYRLIDINSPATALAELFDEHGIDAETVVRALTKHSDVSRVVGLLAASEQGLLVAQAAVIEERKRLVSRLKVLIDNPETTEQQIQNLIGSAHWIFGGRYVGVADRRTLTLLDQHDIPLLGADGTLHIVELKRPVERQIVVRHRNHWIAGPAVHEATAQASNYLRALDEQGLAMSQMFSNELNQNYDMSRCFATVVIGKTSSSQHPDATPQIVARTLRQYSASLSRVQVIAYDQLVDSAERALEFESGMINDRSG